ncbi:helix-turn-helix transcriptional regulator [Dokdonella soli]|uniref:Helix-turn-helix transcriptional regulator n=1 Tax=Dokdonella soli TaxID=529810 RepID=A0ABN1IDS8_9GAMM
MKINSSANKRGREELSDRLRTARHRADLSQTELANAVGVSASAVAQWEHPSGTQPSLGNLVLVAQVTRVSFEWLATGNTSRKSPRISAAAEVPAIALDAYARTLQEETLLDHFRQLSARRQALVVTIVTEFASPVRSRASKRS